MFHFELRDYQEQAIRAIWSELSLSQKALCVMSTGSGKSIVIAGLVKKAIEAKPDIKILILFNKITLLEQLADKFKELLGFDQVGIYCSTSGEWDLSKQVTVGSIQSMSEDKLNFNLIIIDECHNLNESSGKYIKFTQAQLDQNPKTKVVGFTATPFRFDGYIYGKDKFWPKPCFERGLSYFIDKKMLVMPIAKQPDHLIDISKLRVRSGEYVQSDVDAQTLNKQFAERQVADALMRAAGRKKIVWFCSSIKHAELIKDTLLAASEKAVCIHSALDWDCRDKALLDFTQGDARHLTFVSIVSEGFDYPPIDCVVLMRPTKSPVLMVQTCGRGLRPSDGKENCLILDYANVISTLGPLDAPVIRTNKRGKSIAKPTQKVCPSCRAYLPINAQKCFSCGYEYPKLNAAKIDLIANQDINLIGKRELKTMRVKNVTMEYHKSSNGNDCVKIMYWPDSFLDYPIVEYFSWASDFSLKKFQIRAIEMNIELKADALTQSLMRIGRVPYSIEYVMENKYPKVKKLNFIGDQNDKKDLQLFEKDFAKSNYIKKFFSIK
jgi:DNA repair protein RadD